MTSHALVQSTSAKVYQVIPDDHYYPTSDKTYTLQHYLNNTSKYFTSNVQLHFLPGQYFLNTDLIISNISNFSLVGNISDGEVHTVINCTSPAGVLVIDSDNIFFGNIVMWECSNDLKLKKTTLVRTFRFNSKTLLILNSTTVEVIHFHSLSSSHTEKCRVHLRNTQSLSILSNITSNCIKVEYTDSQLSATSHAVEINKYKSYESSLYSLQISHKSNSNINITVSESNFHKYKSVLFKCDYCSGESILNIIRCVFTSVEESYYKSYTNAIEISTDSCNNIFVISVTILHCEFQNYQGNSRHMIDVDIDCWTKVKSTLLIKNTTFQSITDVYSVIYVKNIIVYFQQHVTLSSIKSAYSIIEVHNGYLQIHNYTEIRNSSVYTLTNIAEIYIEEYTMLHITYNNATLLFSLPIDKSYPTILSAASPIESLVSPCLFQYLSKQGNLDNHTFQDTKLNYQILLHHNLARLFSDVKYRVTHCSWTPNTAFVEAHSNYVSQKVIQFYRNNFTLEGYKQICLCKHMNESNCLQDELSPVYPGQTVTFQFILVDSLSKGLFQIEDRPDHACRSHDQPMVSEINDEQCISVNYTMQYREGGQCELYTTVKVNCSVTNPFLLTIPLTYPVSTIEGNADIFYVPLQSCPKGFSLSSSGYCKCDPVLSHILVHLTCDINDGTIPRPGDSWISANTINNKHTYRVSLKCPFDYCLPHSTYTNLSNNVDTQCQFSRYGVLCGQCQPGLSAVFGSSQCKNCPNVYVLIIAPIALVGAIVVCLLFFLNFTVTDGNINTFLLYVNIVSFNIPTFFPNQDPSVALAHSYISLANLDLGIETCFYNGMDDYAKMWLQLTFPMYIIFIATILIIASRYSTMIQRLTARRALPVLATLFLLSYTKILCTVCNVMFFYTTITHLPSGHTTLVWSVDANVPLFGVKFTILFTVCLLLFLILLPFNVILLFTRTLSHLKFINHFKPLLDAFQGPYKDKFYYWTGLQLLLRAVFFGVSALDRRTSLMVSIILVGVMISIHGYFRPFKDKTNNNLELLLLLNLQVLFVVSIYNTPNVVAVNILIAMAFVQLVYIVLKHVQQHLPNKCSNVIDTAKYIFKLCLSSFQSSTAVNRLQNIELRGIIPEVAHNYNEFQDSLIGVD